jgi:L-rhamnose isomerase/sugar isomerase
MRIEKYKVDELNHQLLDKHRRDFDYVAADVRNLNDVMQKLAAFNVAIPSWALGTGGTRFGRFSGGGEPGSLEEKIEDVGVIHALNQSSNSISLHIPWDIPENAGSIKAMAGELGLHFDAVNSNTFQDQKDQKLSYKFGSLHIRTRPYANKPLSTISR